MVGGSLNSSKQGNLRSGAPILSTYYSDFGLKRRSASG
jgi:hypothetical protein